MPKTTDVACPCGGVSFARCCNRFLSGAEIAATAGQLMRSRYSAYVLRDEAYLQISWHPSTRPTAPVTDADTKWLGLEVRAETQNADSATVEFVARYRVDGRGQRMHEVSRFTRQAGRWLYVDGSFPEK